MRLNLGCGNDIRPDYLNVDFRDPEVPLVGDFQRVDLSAIPWPFGDGCAEEVMMLDFLEHFPMSHTHYILKECHRILRRTGSIIVQVPDMVVLGRALSRSPTTRCNSCGKRLVDDPGRENCGRCGQSWHQIEEAAIRRLYGGQDYAGNFHQAGFTMHMLAQALVSAGFSGIVPMDVEHQEANWNMKVFARKF